jgi:hypothetical protein
MNDLNPPHFPNAFYETSHPFRHRPAEWCPWRRQWIQDGRVLRNVKASKAFVWPKDGRNGTPWGRLKDILQNKGPDIYLTMNATKRDYMHNRPTKARWSGHVHLDDNLHSSYPFGGRKYASWTAKGVLGGRVPGQTYDFRTRKYGDANWWTWTDAVWQPKSRVNKRNPYPEAVRDMDGDWLQDWHYVPHYMGGPIDNELGRGL